MDHCEIILDSIQKVVNATIKNNQSQMAYTTYEIIENKGQGHYVGQDTNGIKRNIETDNINLYTLSIGDRVYGIENSIIAKIVSESSTSIDVIEGFNNFIPYQTFKLESSGTIKLSTNKMYDRLAISTTLTSNNQYANIVIFVIDEQGGAQKFTFNEKDIIGNKLYLKDTLQKQIYTLSNKKITQIKCAFDNIDDFNEGIEILLGYSQEGLINSSEMGLKIDCAQNSYTLNAAGQITQDFPLDISWTWTYVDNDILQKYDSTSSDEDSIIYYVYDINFDSGDEFGGLNWKRVGTKVIPSEHFLSDAQTTKIKGIILTENDAVVSNELEFNNIQTIIPSSPYQIVLEEDFVSIQTGSDNVIDNFPYEEVPIYFNVTSGKHTLAPEGYTLCNSISQLSTLHNTVLITANNLTIGEYLTREDGVKGIQWSNLTADRGTITFKYYEAGNTEYSAVATFEARKNRGGVDGQIISLVSSHEAVKIKDGLYSPSEIVYTLKTKTGNKPPVSSNFTGYYGISVDNNIEKRSDKIEDKNQLTISLKELNPINNIILNWYDESENLIDYTQVNILADGLSAYTLALTNDSEVLVRTSSGIIKDKNEEVLTYTSVSYLYGNEIIETTVTCVPPSDSWKENTHYTFNDNILKIQAIPNDFIKGDFVFSVNTISKTFSLNIIDSNTDYNLILPKSVINSSLGDQTTSVQVKKIEIGGEFNILQEPENSIKVYYTTGEGNRTELTNWQDTILIKKDSVDNIKIELEVDNIIFDTETIEIVNNGKNGASSYKLSLDNDYDMIAIDSNNNNISEMPIIVNASAYEGTEILTSVNYQITCAPTDAVIIYRNSDTSSWDINNLYYIPSAQDATKNGYYYYDTTAQKWIRETGNWHVFAAIEGVLDTNKLYYVQGTNSLWVYNADKWATGNYWLQSHNMGPNGTVQNVSAWWYSYNQTNCQLVINTYKQDTNFLFQLLTAPYYNVKDQETFVLKSMQSLVDYNLLVEPVINNSDIVEDTSIAIKVRKIEKGSAQILEETTDNLLIYQDNNTTPISNWSTGVKYNGKTKQIKLILKQDNIIWDEEVIEFVQNGEDGTSPYKLTLNNDMDLVAITPNGESISELPIIVNASAYYGHSKMANSEYNIVCLPITKTLILKDPGEQERNTELMYYNSSEGKYYYFNSTWIGINGPFTNASENLPLDKSKIYGIAVTNGEYDLWGWDDKSSAWQKCYDEPGDVWQEDYWEYSNGILKIKKCAAECNFLFSLYIDGELKDEETFKIKTIVSQVDYDFIIETTVINNSNTNGNVSIPIKVRKKDQSGITVLEKSADNLIIEQNGTTIQNWATDITYSNLTTSPMTIRLKQNDIVWDEETIEFVQNGKKGDTGDRGPQGDQIVGILTGAKLEEWITGQYSVGKTVTITITENNIWNKLALNDSCKFTSTVLDQYSSPGINVRVVVSGIIVDYTNKKIQIQAHQFDGSQANITYDNMYAALEGKDKSGIIQSSYIDENGNTQTAIGLNADYINTGALRIGPPLTENEDKTENALLYGDIVGNNLKLAGWTVTEDTLQNSDGSVILASRLGGITTSFTTRTNIPTPFLAAGNNTIRRATNYYPNVLDLGGVVAGTPMTIEFKVISFGLTEFVANGVSCNEENINISIISSEYTAEVATITISASAINEEGNKNCTELYLDYYFKGASFLAFDNGEVHIQNAVVNGAIYATSIEAPAGKIGPFTIGVDSSKKQGFFSVYNSLGQDDEESKFQQMFPGWFYQQYKNIDASSNYSKWIGRIKNLTCNLTPRYSQTSEILKDGSFDLLNISATYIIHPDGLGDSHASALKHSAPLLRVESNGKTHMSEIILGERTEDDGHLSSVILNREGIWIKQWDDQDGSYRTTLKLQLLQ